MDDHQAGPVGNQGSVANECSHPIMADLDLGSSIWLILDVLWPAFFTALVYRWQSSLTQMSRHLFSADSWDQFSATLACHLIEAFSPSGFVPAASQEPLRAPTSIRLHFEEESQHIW